MKPRIFISAVTSELGTTRQLVANVLSRLGYDPVWQDIFGTEPGDLRQALRDKIDDCDGLIHLVGRAYGAELPEPDAEFGRLSYTQYELKYAQKVNKRTWIVFAEDGCSRNKPLEQFDLPHNPAYSDPSAYQAERRALQDAWRERLKSDTHSFHGAASDAELELKVERMRDEFAELRRHFRSWQKRVLMASAAIAVLVGCVLAGQWSLKQDTGEIKQATQAIRDNAHSAQQQTEQKIEEVGQQTASRVESIVEQAVQQLANPAVLVERIRKELHATAEAKIKSLPDEYGRGRLIAEIEKDRDLALGRVDDLIELIQEGLKEGASPIFQRAAEILEKEGTEAALEYLDRRRPTTLEAARRHAEQAKGAQAHADDEKHQRNNALQPLVLEAKLLETKLQLQRALNIHEQVAELAPDWFDARNATGLIHLELAHFREAERHLRTAAGLGANTENEAMGLNNLAQLLQATNRLAEAESLMRRALTIDEQSKGTEHPDVALQLNNLAALLTLTNGLEEAEPLMRRALAIDEQSYGAEHPDVARDLNNLAQLLQATNRLAEAEPLMRRALAIDEQSYGENHPSVGIDLNNLALLLKATDRLAAAETLMRRALAIDEQSYGAEHPTIARDLNNLAQLLQDTNRLTQAESMNRRALAIDEQYYGAEHAEVATDLNNLVSLLHAMKRMTDAEPLMRRALAIGEQSYGAEHPKVGTSLNNLAQLLHDTNRLVEAEPLMRRALAIDEQSYGADHPKVAIRLNNLAQLLHDTNRSAEAEPLMRRALAIDEQSYGAEHRDIAIRLNNLAQLLKATSRLAEAEPLYRRAAAIVEQSLGAEHPKVATLLNNLALLLQATGRLPEAEPLYRRALTIDEQSYGAEHPNVAIDLNNLALLLQTTNRLAEAKPIMRRALAICAMKLVKNHPNTIAARENYRAVLAGLKLPAEEVERRLKETIEATDALTPIVPEVERMLGPIQPVADVLARLDQQYKAERKPAIYFLPLGQPITPYLDKYLKPNADAFSSLGLSAFRQKSHADAVVLFDETIKLFVADSQQMQIILTTRMNRAAALLELGDVEQARAELLNLIPDLDQAVETSAIVKGRSRYHLALCEWRLGDREDAQHTAEESLAAYGDDPAGAVLTQQTEQLLADLKENKPLPPLPIVDSAAELEQARKRYHARTALTSLPLDQPSAPLLDQMLGPAKSTQEVFEALDEQYRHQNKPPIWFLPLTEPIAPHLDELLGPLPKEEVIRD